MAKRTKIAAVPALLAPPDLRFLNSFDKLNCGLVASTAEGVVILINQKLLNWLGYEEEEVLGRPAEEFVPPELRPILQEERQATQKGDIRARLLALQRKDSTTFPVVLLPHALFDSKGTVIGGFSMIIELATVQTAKRLGGGEYDLASNLQRIALELEALGLAAQMPPGKPLPLAHPRLRSLSPREKEVLVHLVAASPLYQKKIDKVGPGVIC